MRHRRAPVALLIASAIAYFSCAPRADDPAIERVVLRHQDVEVSEDGSLLPILVAPEHFELCVGTPTNIDTSQWQARIYVDDATEAPLVDPTYQLGPALCFRKQIPPQLEASSRLELCAEIRDSFDENHIAEPCVAFRFEPKASSYATRRQELEDEMQLLFSDRPIEESLRDLDRLVERAADYPYLRVRLQRVAVYHLRREGTTETLTEAQRRLELLPAWLEQDEAKPHLAGVLVDRARLQMTQGDLDAARVFFARSEELYREASSPSRIRAVSGLSTLQAQVGVVRPGLEPLRRAIAECETACPDCDPSICPSPWVAAAWNLWAWLLHLDPESKPEDREEAVRRMAETIEEKIPGDTGRLEHANLILSLAHYRAMDGDDPRQRLADARQILARSGSSKARSRGLENWSHLIEALFALSKGQAEDSLKLCLNLASSLDAADSSSLDMAVWALSCIGRSHYQQGNVEAARDAFEQALLRHEHASFDELDQTVTLGPGQRADDYYQAARIELELGQPRAAWEILDRLDRLSFNEEELRRCRGALSPEKKEALSTSEAERLRLLSELSALERPASGSRKRQVEVLRQTLKQQIQDLWRQQPGCPREERPTTAPEIAFRAIPLEDEILLLRRESSGAVHLERRTPFARDDLRRRIEKIHETLAHPMTDGTAWRDLVAPLARALTPRHTPLPQTRPQVTPFALHGLLQAVPLAALPVAGESEGANRWFSELWTPVLLPAGTSSFAGDTETATSSALFVVDPKRNLPSATASLRTYRKLFPEARFLSGREATASAFQDAVAGSQWLHVDTHGTFDAAFPQLSSLAFADSEMTFPELATLGVPRSLVNLSGCQTARWPTTADSGRYGLAGLFARRGVEWVIGTRSDLDDQLAADFNRAFYGEMAAGSAVPASFATALAEVRDTHPPATWAALMLLRGAR